MRKRAGVIVYCESSKKILLINRKKQFEDYWVVPGGGLEGNENFEIAAKREIWEELNLKVKTMTELCTITTETSIEKYFISAIRETKCFTICGDELLRSNENNIYNPEWVSINEIDRINLLPSQLKIELIKYFEE